MSPGGRIEQHDAVRPRLGRRGAPLAALGDSRTLGERWGETLGHGRHHELGPSLAQGDRVTGAQERGGVDAATVHERPVAARQVRHQPLAPTLPQLGVHTGHDASGLPGEHDGAVGVAAQPRDRLLNLDGAVRRGIDQLQVGRGATPLARRSGTRRRGTGERRTARRRSAPARRWVPARRSIGTDMSTVRRSVGSRRSTPERRSSSWRRSPRVRRSGSGS